MVVEANQLNLPFLVMLNPFVVRMIDTIIDLLDPIDPFQINLAITTIADTYLAIY